VEKLDHVHKVEKGGSASVWRRGDLFIWLVGGAVGVNVLLIAGFIGIVLVNGLGFFWPSAIWEMRLRDGSVWLGELVMREEIPHSLTPEGEPRYRLQLKVGNRDVFGADFKWIDEDQIVERRLPSDVVCLERVEWGNAYGRLAYFAKGHHTLTSDPETIWLEVQTPLAQARKTAAHIKRMEIQEVGDINRRIEFLRLEERRLALQGGTEADRFQKVEALKLAVHVEQGKYQRLMEAIGQLRPRLHEYRLGLALADGRVKEMTLGQVIQITRPNRMGFWEKSWHYARAVGKFIWEDPRESNTEGGVFPAIFGTVMMVMIMSVVTVPLGVVVALYMREYATQGVVVRLVRIAVNNLAGVPSIVFGVFGLGFFVYFVGHSVDVWWFPERLPTPTYGTGGILWASLTLALLTLPVVVVATEEALAAVPRSFREASLALGATQWTTMWRVVLPSAAPGILTGMILAMARGAGEVAPLMMTGVVKLAPTLPIDHHFPFVHLDRKFMHLGFHIYDVGFQSPNVEAAKPMVFATTILLLAVIVGLNLTAIVVRNHLKKKYQHGAFN